MNDPLRHADPLTSFLHQQPAEIEQKIRDPRQIQLEAELVVARQEIDTLREEVQTLNDLVFVADLRTRYWKKSAKALAAAGLILLLGLAAKLWLEH